MPELRRPGVTLTASGGARMQGLPEWAEHHSLHRAAMKHAGNAVAVPMARELIRQLGDILGSRKPAI